jgi:hypothetical protein
MSFADRVIRVALYLERFAILDMNQDSAFAMTRATNRPYDSFHYSLLGYYGARETLGGYGTL